MSEDKGGFILTGTREIFTVDAPPNVLNIAAELERAVDEVSSTASDLSKALVECVCKTILNDRGIELSSTWDFPKLFRETVGCLQLFPDNYDHPQDAQRGLSRVLRGLQQAIQGMSELRNLDGLASHGPDGYDVSLDAIHLLLCARAADTIVHFLYSVHKRRPSPQKGRLYYVGL